ncbi:shikimate kinase AroK [Gammaproteobacteria bacterium AH-315-C21]|nr:shikimate kinase AroK [Gammaproteobacteria bacterium AH-315-C21]
MLQSSSQQNIFLIGLMGSGKSTIGRQLARAGKLEFFDSDAEIVERTGAEIAWIFDIEGESGFRKREKIVIDDLTQRSGIVLATGGGSVLDSDNRRVLTSRGIIVYISASLERLFKRTSKDKSRPLLNRDDPYAVLQALQKERDPLYREIADMVIETDDCTVAQAVKQIRSQIQASQTG